jgi:hypothetical protein
MRRQESALHLRGLEKNGAIYETPTIVLVTNFVCRWRSAFIGLVCCERRACYTADPQNGRNEFTRILKRHSQSFEVNKQDAPARYPKPSVERTLPVRRETLR